MKPFCSALALAAAVMAVVVAQRRGRTGGAGGDYGAPPPSGGQAQYSGNGGGQSSPSGGGGDDHQGLDWLLKSVPGQPGTDYPIFAEVPETGFGCEGQVEGGYYADPEAECQAFHVCTADGLGGLAKYSFLCPNGTIFNQEYFICDWWFNFDCSAAEGLYSLNEDIAAEREAASPANGGGNGGNGGNGGGNGGNGGGYSSPQAQYGAGR